MTGVKLTKETAQRMGEATIIVENTYSEVLPSQDVPRRKSNAGTGTGGSSIYFCSITGTGADTWTWAADIYSEFASDMTFSGITKHEAGATVKIPKANLYTGNTIATGTVFAVIEFTVNSATAWVAIQHVGSI